MKNCCTGVINEYSTIVLETAPYGKVSRYAPLPFKTWSCALLPDSRYCIYALMANWQLYSLRCTIAVYVGLPMTHELLIMHFQSSHSEICTSAVSCSDEI